MMARVCVCVRVWGPCGSGGSGGGGGGRWWWAHREQPNDVELATHFTRGRGRRGAGMYARVGEDEENVELDRV